MRIVRLLAENVELHRRSVIRFRLGEGFERSRDMIKPQEDANSPLSNSSSNYSNYKSMTS